MQEAHTRTARKRTQSECVVIGVMRGCPVLASHSRIVRSSLPDAIVRPSGDTATTDTASSCPRIGLPRDAACPISTG
jgi:hypothetical protein